MALYWDQILSNGEFWASLDKGVVAKALDKKKKVLPSASLFQPSANHCFLGSCGTALPLNVPMLKMLEKHWQLARLVPAITSSLFLGEEFSCLCCLQKPFLVEASMFCSPSQNSWNHGRWEMEGSRLGIWVSILAELPMFASWYLPSWKALFLTSLVGPGQK